MVNQSPTPPLKSPSRSSNPQTRHDALRAAAESDLITFIRLVAPHRVLGSIHEELIGWWTRQDAKSHQLVLLPRDHAKSAMLAYRVAWEITRDPAIRVLYISSTSNLAEKQLKMIKDILTSKIYRRYWPLMINEDEGKREKWTNSEISVDHPRRKAEGVRDPTVFTGGLTTSLTGLHCDIACLDDVVVQENAYTGDGREKVTSQYSLLASIEAADAMEWVVGTRYHPKDLYSDLLEMNEELYNEEGDLLNEEPVYESFVRTVEDIGNGSGEFLWPRQQRSYDGKYFGFNQQILAKKKAQYLDKTQFFAQYYNDPNRYESSLIGSECFQYYDKSRVVNTNGRVTYGGRPLSVFAAMDFAYTLGKKSDYTAIVVVGIDASGFIYVLDVVRFKTAKISEMFERLLETHVRWDFRKVRMESTAAQSAIVRELKDQYIRPNALALAVEEYKPNRSEGSKEERINAILQPRYENRTIWHYKGGACQMLEEELINRHPPHDDIKDALANAVTIAIPPRKLKEQTVTSNVIYSPRFGGVGF